MMVDSKTLRGGVTKHNSMRWWTIQLYAVVDSTTLRSDGHWTVYLDVGVYTVQYTSTWWWTVQFYAVVNTTSS